MKFQDRKVILITGPALLSETAIIKRKKIRGRENDQGDEQELESTRNQLACIASNYIEDEWIIDNSKLAVEVVYIRHFLAFVEEPT